jgi:hypothetical protein
MLRFLQVYVTIGSLLGLKIRVLDCKSGTIYNVTFVLFAHYPVRFFDLLADLSCQNMIEHYEV